MTYQLLRDIVRQERSALVVTCVGAGGSPSSPQDASHNPPPAGVALGGRLIQVQGEPWVGTLGDSTLDAAAQAAAAQCEETGTVAIEVPTVPGCQVDLFVERFRPPPKLVIVGAVHVAIHLVHFAKRLGFRCIVVDARAPFATRERFPHADELLVRWPSRALEEMPVHDETYCVFLTHDPKLDDPALQVALRRGAGYVGALGSTRTHAKRKQSLRELGLEDDLIARIHAPIGLDLGGRKPEEIALSIAAQMVARRYGKDPVT